MIAIRFLSKVLGGLIFAIPVVYAQESADERDLALTFGDTETITIATGSQQPISRAPAVASVITAEDIKAMGATDLDQVLETVPGIHVSLSSYRFSPIYSIRGIYSDSNPQVLVLVNGTPMTQLLLGDRGFRSTLPIADVARIEVIRGPGSAIYGSDAFAGVINVITKTAADIHGTEAGLRSGSSTTRDAWVLHGGDWNKFGIAFSLEWSREGNDDTRKVDSDQQTIIDSLIGTRSSLAPNHVETRQKRLDAHFNVARNNWNFHLWNWRQYGVGVGPGVALALDPSGEATADNFLTELIYHNPKMSEHLDFTSRLSYMAINTKSEQHLFPPGTTLPIGDDGNINFLSPAGVVLFTDGLIGNPAVYERHYRFSSDLFYTGIRNNRIRIGVGINYAELYANETKNYGPGVIDGTVPVIDGVLTSVSGTRYIFITPRSRTNPFAFAQDEWSFARDWNATAGLRFDNYSDFGNTVNPRAAVVWQTKYDLTSKILYGRAFRAPSFTELFVINNPIRLGNPKLSPETIDTLEVAFDYQPTFDLNTKLNLFSYKIHNQITPVTHTGGASFTFENTGQQEGRGLEWETIWKVSKSIKLHGNYAYQQTSSDQSDNISGYAPRHHINLITDWQITNNLVFGTEANWISGRKRSSADARPPIKDYITLDLSLRKIITNSPWEAAISVRNIFDQHPREPSPYSPPSAPIPNDFPLTGRSGYLEISYHIQR